MAADRNSNLKNTGRFVGPLVTGDYSWKVPSGTPVQVYLRVRVLRPSRQRRNRGDDDMLQFVDLVEPEGRPSSAFCRRRKGLDFPCTLGALVPLA